MVISASAALLNDLHSGLNPTVVNDVVRVKCADDVIAAVKRAAVTGKKVSISAGRHAMGAQQFGSGALHLDMSGLNQVNAFDRENGAITVGSGMQWPELIDYLCTVQINDAEPWTIAQKQTGCDKLSIGGAVSANVHGRGLKMKPFISDVVSFEIVTADGALRRCSRKENVELFSLAAGGYGLFGVIVAVTFRLARRVALQRVVSIIDCTELMERFEQRIADGFTYGDFQFSIDEESDDFLRKGILSTYRPIASLRSDEAAASVSLSVSDWKRLLYLAHTDKQRAFDEYASHYLSTSGQVYSSDRFQLATYLDAYHEQLDKLMGCEHPASEIISELYVPRKELARFLLAARDVLRECQANVIYGTVRLIERDEESFLAWAREDFACTIFNLHTEHTDEGKNRSARAFRALIDLAASFGGSYYLTYHKFASREQLVRCYRQFDEFVRRKLDHDPREMFSSDWYRHYRASAIAD